MRKTILTTLTVVMTLSAIFGAGYLVIEDIHYEKQYYQLRNLGCSQKEAEELVELQRQIDRKWH